MRRTITHAARFGERVRRLRGERTQVSIAHAAKMDPADLCRIEAGESERGPSLSTIHRLAKALGVDPSELVTDARPAA